MSEWCIACKKHGGSMGGTWGGMCGYCLSSDRDELIAGVLALSRLGGGCSAGAVFLEDEDAALSGDALELKRAWQRLMKFCNAKLPGAE